ncbi:hypothetical protein L6452_19268 [Arctium lappa]|uniref:Uncharacterized protein n=1 Tax=Arctium lappa TaxID=4217 RepID=A0ACB9B7Q3_ARCLA|nr:hypothetical protein L6452_19268 [Arctium lappa]
MRGVSTNCIDSTPQANKARSHGGKEKEEAPQVSEMPVYYGFFVFQELMEILFESSYRVNPEFDQGKFVHVYLHASAPVWDPELDCECILDLLLQLMIGFWASERCYQESI